MKNLDPGISEIVIALNDAGVVTAESCEGGEGHAYYEPTVALLGGSAVGWRALSVCKELRLPVRTLRREWPIRDGEPSGPFWYLTFSRLNARTNGSADTRYHPTACSQVLSADRSDNPSSRDTPSGLFRRSSSNAGTD
jgi:hypothetical protein